MFMWVINLKTRTNIDWTQVLNAQQVTNFIQNDLYHNGGQLKNPDISGALYKLRIQYKYTQTPCEDGARDVRVL